MRKPARVKRRWPPGAAVIACTAAVLGMPTATADKQTHTLVLNQSPPSLRPVDGGVPGPQLRAVVGGTGSFMGARGQVMTTRNPDGSYRHEFTLIDD